MKRLITICLVAILGVAGTANAVITFSEFPVGTVISNQYAPQGVIFWAETYNLPKIDMDSDMPTQPILRPDGGPETYKGDFWMEFTTPVLDVDFDSVADLVRNRPVSPFVFAEQFLPTVIVIVFIEHHPDTLPSVKLRDYLKAVHIRGISADCLLTDGKTFSGKERRLG